MSVHRATRPVSTLFLSPLLAFLALAVLLFAVLTLHSEATGHDMHMAGSSPPDAVSASVGVVTIAAAGSVAPVVASLSAGTHTGMLDCALMAMTCVLLLVLIALVFLTRLPATFRRLLESGRTLLSIADTLAVSVARPSLTILSISRV